MILCDYGCHPCCDFCHHAWFDIWLDDNGNAHKAGPAGCSIHIDEEHKNIAMSCGHCEDFHCIRVD